MIERIDFRCRTKQYETAQDAAWDMLCNDETVKSYKSARDNILRCCKGKKMTAYGYRWRFIDAN